MQLDGLIDALNIPLFSAYLLIGSLLVCAAFGWIGSGTRQARIASGFLAGILLPAGATFVFDNDTLTVITLSIRICAAWGLLVWWLLGGARE